MRDFLIIGVGNVYRGDDGAGILVARFFRRKFPANVFILSENFEDIFEFWRGFRKVFIIDAVKSGQSPGKIFRFEAHREPLPVKFFLKSTHHLGIAEYIELARSFKVLPSEVMVYGIEGLDFSYGAGISDEVRKACKEVVAMISRVISL